MALRMANWLYLTQLMTIVVRLAIKYNTNMYRSFVQAIYKHGAAA